MLQWPSDCVGKHVVSFGLGPDAGVAEVQVALSELHDRIKNLSQNEAEDAMNWFRHWYPNRKPFHLSQIVEEDMVLLRDLVEKRGSFANAMLPDGDKPIVAVHNWNPGNSAIFATDTFYFCMQFVNN